MTRQIDVLDDLLARGADINSARCDGARPIQLTNGDYHYRGWRDVPQDWPTTPSQVLAHLRASDAYVDICPSPGIPYLDRLTPLLPQTHPLPNPHSDHATI